MNDPLMISRANPEKLFLIMLYSNQSVAVFLDDALRACPLKIID